MGIRPKILPKVREITFQEDQFPLYSHFPRIEVSSLMLPDPLRTGTYRLEIISTVLRGSDTIHSTKKYVSQQFSLGVNKVTCAFTELKIIAFHRSFSDPFWYITNQIQFGRKYFIVHFQWGSH